MVGEVKDSSEAPRGTYALVEALTQDLRETGEHLRATDRKVYLVVQLYGGFVVILATLVAALLQSDVKLDFLAELPGLAPLLLLMFLSWWVFYFTLRSRELKKTYINRMNFVRREIQIALNNERSAQGGYWTQPVGKDRVSRAQETKMPRLPQVGLDDLYPLGLAILILVLSVPMILLMVQIAERAAPLSTVSNLLDAGKLGAVAAISTILLFSALLYASWRRSNHKIQEQLTYIWDFQGDVSLNTDEEETR